MSSSSARGRFPVALDNVTRSASRASRRDTGAAVPMMSVKAEARHPAVSASPVALVRTPAKRGAAVSNPRSDAVAATPGAAAHRHLMVARLASEGFAQERVLAAMESMPRHAFVDAGLATQAYEDTALPIGHGQTISKPSMVARMLGLLAQGDSARERGHLGRALEIGTGCGYQAALLSMLSTSVISVERLRVLHELARMRLDAVDEVRRVALRLVLGDGRMGHPPNAPYDSIVAAAVGESIPTAWIDQLAVGGRLVAPQGVAGAQVLVVVDKHIGGIVEQHHEAVRFVPLESGVVR